MKPLIKIYFLFISISASISMLNAETIPLEKGNTWIYSYSKKDSSRANPCGNCPSEYDLMNHCVGILLLKIDSTKKFSGPIDTQFFWLTIIDSGVIHRTEWDTSSNKFVTTTKEYKNAWDLKSYFSNENFVTIDTIPYHLLCPLIYNIPGDTFVNLSMQFRKIKTDSTKISMQNQERAVYSTLIDDKWWSHLTFINFKRHQWISHVGTAYWLNDSYSHHSMARAGSRYVDEFVLQSFNGNSIPVINVIETKNAMQSKATSIVPVNRIFHKTVLINDKTTSMVCSMNRYFTIQGQKVENSKCCQLFLQKILQDRK